MNIKIKSPGEKVHNVLSADVSGDVTLFEVFNGVGIVTEDGEVFSVCLRDSGLEIKCPDGTLVGVKRYDDGGKHKRGDTFIERNGKFVHEQG